MNRTPKSKRSTKSINPTKPKKVELTHDGAATRIQSLIRRFVAIARVKIVANRVWRRVYDPSTGLYFWYNTLHDESTWIRPKYVTLYNQEDEEAAALIQVIIRGFIGKMRARKVAHEQYTRFYDSKVNKFYWMKNSTGKTTWKVSNWLARQEVPMPPEDTMLYDSQQKIRELEQKLLEKEFEIKEVRKARFEELEPQVLMDKVQNVRNLRRSRNMDDWKVEDLAAWFTELKMEQYIPFVHLNR